jgi:hypothetical protein
LSENHLRKILHRLWFIYPEGVRSANAGAIATSSTASGIGRAVGTAAFRSTMAVVGVIFTTIDIALLVKEWKSLNPTKETVKAVIEEIKAELEQYQQLDLKLKTVRDSIFFAGWLKENTIAIIGTSPFAVEALLALCRLDFKKVESIYGDSFNLCKDDHKLSTLSIIYSQELAACPRTLNVIKELIEEQMSPSEENKTVAFLVSSQKPKLSEPIVDIDYISNYLPVLEEHMPISAFNLDVFELNKRIIDDFLFQEGYPSFEILKEHLIGTALVEDYGNPLSSNAVHLISKVTVAYTRHGGYLSANKFEYNLTTRHLQQHAVSYLKEELYSHSSSSDDNQNADEGLGYSQSSSSTPTISPELEHINDLVEILINHKSFIDPVAVAILSKNHEQCNTFETALTSVSKLFTDLQFKIPVWACDLSLALKRFSFSNTFSLKTS